MKNWYIVQSHSSFENKVAALIKEEADKAKISDKFEEIIVPTHDVTEVKRGKRVQRKKKFFPGYVLIKCEMTDDIYHMIKGLKKVSGFLGSKGTPVPVSDKEIEKILGEITFVVKPLCHRKESKISNDEILTLSNQLIGAGLNISKISKIFSTYFNLSKREVYQLLIKNKQ